MSNDAVRIEVEIASQRMILATTPQDEAKLRSASQMVNEHIAAITSSGNRSIERAAIMTALKLAGQVQELQEQLARTVDPEVDSVVLQQLTTQISAIEQEVNIALEYLSLPGSPRSIVP